MIKQCQKNNRKPSIGDIVVLNSDGGLGVVLSSEAEEGGYSVSTDGSTYDYIKLEEFEIIDKDFKLIDNMYSDLNSSPTPCDPRLFGQTVKENVSTNMVNKKPLMGDIVVLCTDRILQNCCDVGSIGEIRETAGPGEIYDAYFCSYDPNAVYVSFGEWGTRLAPEEFEVIDSLNYDCDGTSIQKHVAEDPPVKEDVSTNTLAFHGWLYKLEIRNYQNSDPVLYLIRKCTTCKSEQKYPVQVITYPCCELREG